MEETKMKNKITWLAEATIYDRETDEYIERVTHDEETRREADKWLCEVENEYNKNLDCRCKGRLYAVVECCGEQIQCTNFTNTCDICGADYGLNGDRLAPRSQWGKETGEDWTDCY